MKQSLLLIGLVLLTGSSMFSQTYKVHGKITDNKMDPLAFVTIQVKELNFGTITKEDGTFELELEPGKYDLLITMIGFKPQVITVIIRNEDFVQDVIMETDDTKNLSEVIVKAKLKDRAEEIMRNVIRNKESILAASGPYSCKVYIKATQEDSFSVSRKKRKEIYNDYSVVKDPNADLSKMAMAEIFLQFDYESSQHTREERLALTKRGKAESLFFLTTTDGDFNFYHNLVKVPAVSQVPFLSPVSYSGLLAYRFKTLKIERHGNRKNYIISVKPRQISNATVEGEITISDSSWVILHTRFNLPPYHMPEYDFLQVEQQYSFIGDTAWMITRQQFTYYTKSGKGKKSGQTIATYKDFQLHKEFDKRYFGTEVSVTAKEAYEKDSLFWQSNRAEPLTEKEMRFIHYKDSLYRITHTKQYLDSIDRQINRITWKKLLLSGQTFNNHEKERNWFIPPITSVIQPLEFGGTRIKLSLLYRKTYPSKKNLVLYSDISYGIRNNDVNGMFKFSRLYNPFKRGSFSISMHRGFDHIFPGDAWINMIKRSNIFLNNTIGVGHRREILNGLYINSDIDFAFRKSVSNYKTNPKVDSILGGVLTDNQAIAFASYNAFYGKLKIEYTPGQKFIREPKEKIILGSKWPTFYGRWRKGIPGPFNSKVNFDYIEFGIEQQIKLGLLGISNYNFRTGNFLNKKDLRLVDYKFQRRGDPFLFMNPNEAFQALDSTFPLFKRFYQVHYVHEFNGAIINKIPLLKKLQLREVAGGGFLVAPEINLRYAETFAGIERVFKWPFNPESKFKLGVYVVGSAANKFSNPLQFKIGITTWNKLENKWN